MNRKLFHALIKYIKIKKNSEKICRLVKLYKLNFLLLTLISYKNMINNYHFELI